MTITATREQVGKGTTVWFAYVDGEMLVDRRGVGLRFRSEAAALYAAAEAAEDLKHPSRGDER